MSLYKTVGINAILCKTVEMKGSDLHLTVGSPPVVRVYGNLKRMTMPDILPQDMSDLLLPILKEEQRKQLEKNLELDLSFSIPGISRFRGNIMWQRGTMAASFRVVSIDIPSLATLGLPRVVEDLTRLPRGLVLVTGPTGSGKSTTLAAIIDKINTENSLNIVTIEDPIEFLHNHKRSIIRQREVGSDTHSFNNALRNVVRHDPDVILVGEMRDLESISIVLTAAETGHLVFSTLHTQNAPLSVHRIVDVFPGHMRSQISHQLAGCLQGIVAQQLVPRADGSGQVPAVEVLLTNPAVKNIIREGKEHQLYTVMQTARKTGMQTMDLALADLATQNIITRETALAHCVDQVEMERLLSRTSYFTDER